MMRSLFILPAIAVWLTPCHAARAQMLSPVATLRVTGELAQPDQLSGITFLHDFMILAPDEEASLNILRRTAPDNYTIVSKPRLLEGDNVEIDMEGAASDGNHVYVIGSHSLARKKVDTGGTYKENRKRLSKIKDHQGGDSLFKFKLDEHGGVISKHRISLHNNLKSDPILGRFIDIPSKENGVDIEGIAAKDGKLFLGFRGPVLRGNFAVVLALRFDRPETYELRFLNLDGRGIRDITAVNDGFLLIGGPVGEGLESYTLYFWNGVDGIPGEGAPRCTVVALV